MEKSHHPKSVEEYRIILQDVVEPLTRMSWPPTPKKIVEASIGPLRGSAVNVYSYGVNHAGGVAHYSKVYPIIGEDQTFHKSANCLRINESVKRLYANGLDPLSTRKAEYRL